MSNYNADNLVNAVNQFGSSIKAKYEDLVAQLQQQQELVNRLIDPKSDLFQVLQRRLQDVPDDDENAQAIVEGLRHFRELSKKIANNIQVLQQADDNELKPDRSKIATIVNTIDEIETNNRLLNESLTKILNSPELKGNVTKL